MNIGVDTPQSAALPSQLFDSKTTTVIIGTKPRGRPRKYPKVELASDQPALVKRGRGRPKKTPEVKRGRGRPKKTDIPVSTPIKNIIGTPWKSSVCATNGVSPATSDFKPSLSITDPDYQSSSIDKTIEKLINMTPESTSKTAAVAKRPVGRPGKTLQGNVEVKRAKNDYGDVDDGDVDDGDVVLPTLKSTPMLKISKQMVDRMMEKGKGEQVSRVDGGEGSV